MATHSNIAYLSFLRIVSLSEYLRTIITISHGEQALRKHCAPREIDGEEACVGLWQKYIRIQSARRQRMKTKKTISITQIMSQFQNVIRR